jgi:hypothetical protein
MSTDTHSPGRAPAPGAPARLEEWAAVEPEVPAVVETGVSLPYGELHGDAERLASALHELGSRREPRCPSGAGSGLSGSRSIKHGKLDGRSFS